MSTTTPDEPSFREIKRLLDEAGLRIGQALRLLDELRGDAAAAPALNAKELARVEKVGEVAYRHWAFIQEHGNMRLDDSLAIRRELYGEKVQATANLFGRAGQGAILRRTTKYGTKVNYDQEVVLTEDGERIAKLWKQLHL